MNTCGSYHCSGQRRCILNPLHHSPFTHSDGTFSWDESASVDVPRLIAAREADSRRYNATLNELVRQYEENHESLCIGSPPCKGRCAWPVPETLLTYYAEMEYYDELAMNYDPCEESHRRGEKCV